VSRSEAIIKSVLLIAFQFPPFHGSSAVQRTLRFSQHLPKLGWRPIVLTVTPEAYEATASSQGNEVSAELEVHRAFGFDAQRAFRFFGRYPRALALPDRWASWRFRAVSTALKVIRSRAVDAVWSTFPIATAHRIGLDVARRSGLPWIAEFRDPMWQGDYPSDPVVNRTWLKLEQQIFSTASKVVVTTPGAAEVYANRFPDFPASNIVVLQNGYDEDTFRRATSVMGTEAPVGPAPGEPIKLLHSGVVYRSERDPTQLFAAVATLKQSGKITAQELQIVFRASGDEAGYRRDAEQLRIADIVRIEPPVDYLSALREMLTANGLLILQASNCNAQIPAKLYEYLRAQRPIVALTDPSGDTARTLEAAGAGIIARLDSQREIEAALPRAMDEIRRGTWRRPGSAVVQSYSREAQTGQLARLLDEVAAQARSAGAVR
jgi:glycosyltransferase involved in cell wall biosynthesis